MSQLSNLLFVFCLFYWNAFSCVAKQDTKTPDFWYFIMVLFVHLFLKIKQSQSFLALFVGFPGPRLLLIIVLCPLLLNFQAWISVLFLLTYLFCRTLWAECSTYLGCNLVLLSYTDCLLCPVPCAKQHLCYFLSAI